MEIDIEQILTEVQVIPLSGRAWNRFQITHYSDLGAAEANLLMEGIYQEISQNTGGVYIYHNESNRCLYVGKGADIRNRFRTHYRRANRRDPSGDRHNKHFEFWSTNTGLLKVQWVLVEREVDRRIIEIALTEYLKPRFCVPD